MICKHVNIDLSSLNLVIISCAIEKSLNKRVVMLFEFSQMRNFAVYFSSKSLGKFKFNMNL